MMNLVLLGLHRTSSGHRTAHDNRWNREKDFFRAFPCVFRRWLDAMVLVRATSEKPSRPRMLNKNLALLCPDDDRGGPKSSASIESLKTRWRAESALANETEAHLRSRPKRARTFFSLLSVLPEKRESRGKNEHQRKTSLALSHSLSLSGFPWGPSSSSQGGLVSSSSYNVMLLSLCIYTLYSLYMFYITYNFFSLYCYYLSTSKWGKSRNQSIFQFQSLYSLRFNPFQNIIILYLPL